MLRGQTAPLSPNEEIVLRRIALGVAQPEDLSIRHVRRLEDLALIRRNKTGLELTPLGWSRYEALPRATRPTNGTGDPLTRALMQFLPRPPENDTF
ncbi:hypothetical protein [Reyranella massiliensis]|uniref:hypothetical protein n=1 Tax=Reyranella massiliensis TaxID=445220 RepID=UPI000310612A|nr:hypothetical protein [Reyranella massiliensis]